MELTSKQKNIIAKVKNFANDKMKTIEQELDELEAKKALLEKKWKILHGVEVDTTNMTNGVVVYDANRLKKILVDNGFLL